jgi:hypothetical protein
VRGFRSWFALNMFAPAGREPIGQMAVVSGGSPRS